jgi:DNA-binding NarL/FixJ family response regulator
MLVTDLAADPRLRACVERHAGRFAPSPDAQTVVLFDSASDAADAAIAIQRANAEPRVGIHVGEVVTGDDFGEALAVASGLCGAARPGQILVSELVRMLFGTRADARFEDAEPVDAGAGSGPVAAATLLWGSAPDPAPTRVVVADDAALVRSGIVRLLADGGFEVIAEAADAQMLLARVDADPPDLVVTDIRMPPNHRDEGLRAAAVIRERHPSVAVLVLSQHIEAGAAADLFDDCAAGIGYLLKERVSDLDEFLDACRAVAAGGRVVDPLVSEQLLARRRGDDALGRLSPRECDVLGLMAQGKSNAAIASGLFMSPKTVESHVRSIFTKLDLAGDADEHRRVAAVIRWLQAGR